MSFLSSKKEFVNLSQILLPTIFDQLTDLLQKIDYQIIMDQDFSRNCMKPYAPFQKSEEYNHLFMEWLIKKMNLKGLEQQLALQLDYTYPAEHSEFDDGIQLNFETSLIELVTENSIKSIENALTKIYKCPVEIIIDEKEQDDTSKNT